jgi:hypothetical protein
MKWHVCGSGDEGSGYDDETRLSWSSGARWRDLWSASRAESNAYFT